MEMIKTFRMFPEKRNETKNYKTAKTKLSSSSWFGSNGSLTVVRDPNTFDIDTQPENVSYTVCVCASKCTIINNTASLY